MPCPLAFEQVNTSKFRRLACPGSLKTLTWAFSRRVVESRTAQRELAAGPLAGSAKHRAAPAPAAPTPSRPRLAPVVTFTEPPRAYPARPRGFEPLTFGSVADG